MEFTYIWLKFMVCEYISYMEIIEIIETSRLYWRIFLTCLFFDKGNPSLEVEVDHFLNGFSAKTIVLVRAYNQTLQGTIPFQGCCF